jgi:hypothetical protein
MLVNAGPIRNDGSDKFWGMENVCYPPYLDARQHFTKAINRSLEIHGQSLLLNPTTRD